MSLDLKTLDKVLEMVWPLTKVLLAVMIVAIFLYIFSSLRNKILFEAWINRFDTNDKELGKSMADLLLFNIRSIKVAHERSRDQLGLWNPYSDIPSFKQGLDEDIQLLGSVDLGNYGQFVAGIFTFLLRLLTFAFKPATLTGTVNKYGEKTLYLLTLENYRRKRKGIFWFLSDPPKPILWREEFSDDPSKESLPLHIEKLAYRIYLDLTPGDLFKSWECFKEYTLGLEHYLEYTEFKREEDLRNAMGHYDAALEKEKNNAAVSYNQGVMLYYKYQAESNAKAIELFHHALGTSNTQLRARAYSGLANALSQNFCRFKNATLTDLDKAIEHGRDSLRLNDRLDSAHKALAFACHLRSEALQKKGESLAEEKITKLRNEAIKHYQKSFEINPQHYAAHNNLGNLYLEWAMSLKEEDSKRNQYLENAKKEFEITLGINPAYPFAHDNLGNVHYALEKYEDAEKSYRNALRYDPKYAEAQNDLAMLYLEPTVKENDTTEDAETLHNQALAMLDLEPNSKENDSKQARDLGKIALELNEPRKEKLRLQYSKRKEAVKAKLNI